MGWTTDSIQAVKRAANVADIVGVDCKLEKDGADLVACCTLPGHVDDTPSLRVSTKKNLWKCHGCGKGGSAVDWLQERHGYRFRDAMEHLSTVTGVPLVDEAPDDKPVLVKSRKVATWTYQNEHGDPLYHIERWEPGKHGRSKTFVQRLADGTTGKSPTQVMYRLPRVMNAVEDGRTIYVVEGEKAADALAELGAVATTSAGGTQAKAADKQDVWASPGFADPLRRAHVVLLPDNDDVGREFMAKIAAVLRPLAASVTTVALPLEAKGDDVVEWIDAGGTLADLEDLTSKAQAVVPVAPVTHAPDGGENPASMMLTDTANAEVWASIHRSSFRWNETSGDWLQWDWARWKSGRAGAALLSTKDVSRHWIANIQNAGDKDERRAMLKHAEAAEASSRRKAVLDLAKAEPGVSVVAGELDADPWALNVLNGVIDLRTGDLHPHDPSRLLTKLAPVAYHPTATAPRFERFLAEVLPDAEVRAFMMRVFGYAMTGVVREHVLPVMWGAIGRNGKGTLVETIAAILGDYAMPVPKDLIIEQRNQPHPNLIAQLLGARLCVAAEIKTTDRIDEAQVKNLTGGDSIRARFLGQEFFTFAATHKLILQTNHKPKAPADPALFARMKVIPFTVTFIGREDLGLKAALSTEREGILALLVRACLEWQRDGLGTAEAIEEATEEYREESDPVGQFLAENTVRDGGARTSGSLLYSKYREWCETRGESPWTSTAFGRDMPSRGFRKIKSDGSVFYIGFRMRGSADREGQGQFASPIAKITSRVDRPANPPYPSLPSLISPVEDPEDSQGIFWKEDHEGR
jgi:putative DNA primase/helicase